MKYDVFIRLGGVAPDLPKGYPFTLTILTENGEFVEQTIRAHRDIDLRKAVSIKLHKPSVIEVLAATTAAELGITNADRIVGLKTVLYHLLSKDLLTLPTEAKLNDTDWLDQKLNELRISSSMVRKDIRDWFENPDKYKATWYNLDNSILTVKSVPGGRVVVLPTGHTVAYTVAKSIYWAMLGHDDLYTGTRITVGEYSGTTIRYTKHRLTVKSSTVTVGCQTVPRKAIRDLAEREGWGKSPEY